MRIQPDPPSLVSISVRQDARERHYVDVMSAHITTVQLPSLRRTAPVSANSFSSRWSLWRRRQLGCTNEGKQDRENLEALCGGWWVSKWHRACTAVGSIFSGKKFMFSRSYSVGPIDFERAWLPVCATTRDSAPGVSIAGKHVGARASHGHFGPPNPLHQPSRECRAPRCDAAEMNDYSNVGPYCDGCDVKCSC